MRAGSLAVDPDGNIYATGMIPAELTTVLGTETKIPTKDRFFVAKYKPDLQLSWVESLDDGAYQPLIDPWLNYVVGTPNQLITPMGGMGMPGSPMLSPLLAQWSLERNALLLGGNFKGRRGHSEPGRGNSQCAGQPRRRSVPHGRDRISHVHQRQPGIRGQQRRAD